MTCDPDYLVSDAVGRLDLLRRCVHVAPDHPPGVEQQDVAAPQGEGPVARRVRQVLPEADMDLSQDAVGQQGEREKKMFEKEKSLNPAGSIS